MKIVVASLLALSFCSLTFAGDLAIPKKNNRKPSSTAVKVSGAKAETLFRAILASDESLIDNCTAHTCNFTTKCEYNQTSSEKYVCTVVP